VPDHSPDSALLPHFGILPSAPQLTQPCRKHTLQRAFEEHDQLVPYLKVWCMFDPLRSDPRFQDLVRRMNFPP
jgi:hypothetical protein